MPSSATDAKHPPIAKNPRRLFANDYHAGTDDPASAQEPPLRHDRARDASCLALRNSVNLPSNARSIENMRPPRDVMGRDPAVPTRGVSDVPAPERLEPHLRRGNSPRCPAGWIARRARVEPAWLP